MRPATCTYLERYDTKHAPVLPPPDPATRHNLATMAVTDLTSAPPAGKKAVLFFWAGWHAESAPRGAIDRVFSTLDASAGEGVDFYRVEAEAVPDLSLKVRRRMALRCNMYCDCLLCFVALGELW